MMVLAALLAAVSLWLGEGGPLARVYGHERLTPRQAAESVCSAIRGEDLPLPIPFELYVDEPTPTGGFVPQLIGKGVVESCPMGTPA